MNSINSDAPAEHNVMFGVSLQSLHLYISAYASLEEHKLQ